MGRKPCCEKVGLRRGPWTADEDAKLVAYIAANGICCWRAVPKLAGLLRCGKSCRLRWTNYLRPDLKRGIFTEDEENLILNLHATLGNRWSRIAAQLPGRTDNEIKNYWNTRLKKRLRSQGLDPATHLPLAEGESLEDGDSSAETRSGEKRGAASPPVRQPRGPKPQLKMCQSQEGAVLLKMAKKPAAKPSSPSVLVPKCEAVSSSGSDLSPSPSSCSTVTVGSYESPARKLSSVPSFPEAELWKCIKSTSATTASTAALLDEWDSYSLLLNPSPLGASKVSQEAVDMLPSFTSQQQDLTCNIQQQPESMSWSMDVDMAQPAPESVFAPPSSAPSQDLQKLAAFLDLM